MEEFVLGWIGDPPAKVLEVGCGKGELARALARAGHSVIAIDPRAPEQAPEGPVFRRERIEEFCELGPFDHVVASLSLHHVEDLGMALGKVADLLRAGEHWSWSSSRGTGSTRRRPSGSWNAFRPPPRRRSLRG